ncbi:MAG: 30S ribosomal protein S4 [bacterium]
MLRKKRYKIQRQLNTGLPGFGEKDAKSPLVKRPFPPGMHGKTLRRKPSEYGMRLNEKQKILHHYGLKESQIRTLVVKSKRKESNWFNTFSGLLERRLDNVLFRLGFFPTMASARQMVVHGNVLVNGKKVDIPSLVLPLGSKISLREKFYNNVLFMQTRKKPTLDLPHFLAIETEKGKEIGKVVNLPTPQDIPFTLNIGYVIEYYGKVK